ncbi:MAG: hypothetical protein M1836_001889 [Candelina mexicana]|nr:MAG: hypothetical protein M1836_001889 [Candelina mexicana]
MSSVDPLGAPSSLTARRSAASHLPTFELPPPQLSHLQKYQQPFSAVNVTQPPPANLSVGNLLTPPSNNSGDGLSPISSGVNSGSSGSNNLPPYTPSGYWPPHNQGTTPFGFGSGQTPQPMYATQNPLNPPIPPRGMFSPSLGSLMRNNSNSPTASDGLPPPPYDLNLPPFPTSISVSGPSSLPAIAAQQQQQAMANALMNAHTPVTSGATQQSPTHPTETYGLQRPPPTPTYYGGSQASSTPQQAHFPSYTASSPSQQSPLSSTPARISPTSASHPPILQPAPTQQPHHYSRPFNPYSLPAMSGPILSNVHSPGSQMALVGGMPGGMMPGFSNGQAPNMQHIYGVHQQQPQHQSQQQQQSPQTPQNDRPFKCDQCPQSFNRNHDLKRHKRIHLAVKPFPCTHCEKSFSRKDALKRHILVKGCGKASSSESIEKIDTTISPIDKDESVGSDADDSPVVNGNAITIKGEI